jgi:hypothetical protein
VALGGRASTSLSVDAGVVDDCVHAPDRVDLFRDVPSFGGAAEIADDDSQGTRRKVGERRSALR